MAEETDLESDELDEEFQESEDTGDAEAEEEAAEAAAGADSAEDAEQPDEDDKQPGGELFNDAVDEGPGRPSAGGGDVQLRDSVAGVYEMVKDLEVQLNHMISINEAAERDLEASRRSRRELEKERDGLLRKIEQMTVDAQSSAELREELRHMTRENERLIEKLREVESKTGAWETERNKISGRLALTQAERDEANEEIECLEEQLAEIGQYVEKLRTDIVAARDARQQQSRKVDLVESRMQVVTEERDALRQELNESRSALEEIRRSIMDTNKQSQLSYYET